VRTLCSMVETAGFKILDAEIGWGGRAGTIFCTN
jgi:hypothetical protein